MKRGILIGLILCLVMLIVPSTALAATWDGAETEVLETAEDGSAGTGFYLVDTAEDLAWVAGVVNRDITTGTIPEDPTFNNLTIKLTSDIDLSAHEWVPIGHRVGYYDEFPFEGTFDGGEYDITGLNISSDSYTYTGFFGYSKGIIKNTNIQFSISSTNDYVGGLVGYCNLGEIINCNSSGSVSGNNYVGGIVGDIGNSVVENCHNASSVSATKAGGGIIGRASGSVYVEDCTNSGSVIVEVRHAGGIVGENSADVFNCNNSGSIDALTTLGGITGISDGSVIRCFNTGEVRGRGAIGGIVGRNESEINDCFNSGNVIGEERIFEGSSYEGRYAGGIVGYHVGVIVNCFNEGNIIADNSVGGICGESSYYSHSVISNSYNTGSVSGDDFVGGINGGYYPEHILNCYNIGDISGTGSHVGGIAGRSISSSDICYWLYDVDNSLGIENGAGFSGEYNQIFPFTRTQGQQETAGSGTIIGSGSTYADTDALVVALNNYVTEGNDTYGEATWIVTAGNYPTFAPRHYISASSNIGGSITEEGNIPLYEGDSETFTIEAAGGYLLVDVLVDGISVGAVDSYTFTNVTADHTIEANFEPIYHTITASTGDNGSISPSGDVDVVEGNDQEFTITADSGYQVADVLVDGVSVGAVGSHTFTNVTENHTIEASFEPTIHTIIAGAGDNGSISPSGDVDVNEGHDKTFTITADSGYAIADVLVDGASVGAVSSYTFTNVTADHTIEASFVELHTITASAGDNGSISPSGAIDVVEGDDQAFAFTADSGYQIADVLVDGVSVGAVYSYEFTDVTADHTIEVSFEVIHTIAASAGTGGSIDPAGDVIVADGDDQTFYMVGESGYKAINVIVDGVSVGATDSYTFEDVTEPHEISVVFAPAHIIKVIKPYGGKIEPEPLASNEVMVFHGDDQIFTITPDFGYRIDRVFIDGKDKGPLESYTFRDVTTNHQIQVIFQEGNVITAIAGEGGSIDPEGEVFVDKGEDQAFIITADDGYRIADVLVDNVSQSATDSYLFREVIAPHEIEAIFEPITYTITASAGTGGSIDPVGDVEVVDGSDKKFTITADEDYEIKDVKVDGVSVGAKTSHTIENIKKDYTIEATFEDSAVLGSEAHPFTDVGSKYDAYVQFVYDKKLMFGVSSTEFAPEMGTTRGMIVSVLWRYEGRPSAGKATFQDLTHDWYKSAVYWAAEVKLVYGYNAKEFGPADELNREQFLSILYRYADFYNYDISSTTDISGYSDSSDVSFWAKNKMEWAVAEDLIDPKSGNKLAPQDVVSRGEMAKIFTMFFINVVEE